MGQFGRFDKPSGPPPRQRFPVATATRLQPATNRNTRRGWPVHECAENHRRNNAANIKAGGDATEHLAEGAGRGDLTHDHVARGQMAPQKRPETIITATSPSPANSTSATSAANRVIASRPSSATVAGREVRLTRSRRRARRRRKATDSRSARHSRWRRVCHKAHRRRRPNS